MFLYAILSLLSIALSISPEQLQRDLNSAISDPSIDCYTIPAGDYQFIESDFLINNANDFSIISSSKSIFYFNCTHKVSINNCINVTISNMYIDYDPPCFSQGTLTNYNTDNYSVVVTIDDGYPLPDTSINPIFNAKVVKVIYWNATTKELIYNQTVSNKMNGSIALNNSPPYKYKIFLETMFTIPTIGDAVTIGPRIQNTFVSTNCGNMTFINLTIYASSNMAVLEANGYGNNTYNNYRLMRRANYNHLITSNADAFHSNCNLYGPTLIHSYLEFPGDDFVNVHNRMNILLQRIDDYSVYIIDTLNGITLRHTVKNDNIYFYQLNTQKYLGYGIVDECIRENNETLINEAKQTYTTLQNPPYNAGFVVDYRNTVVVYLVKFKNKLAINITEYNLVEYDLNNGALIENNHFHTGYSSVMKLKSKYSTARNNIFEHAKGVHVAAEQHWLEGELGLRNIMIENNILKGCGTNTTAITVQSNAINVTLYNNTIT